MRDGIKPCTHKNDSIPFMHECICIAEIVYLSRHIKQ